MTEFQDKPLLSTQESESHFTPTHGGIGSLPGSKNEAGIAILPEARKVEKDEKSRDAKISTENSIYIVIFAICSTLVDLFSQINPHLSHPSFPPPPQLQRQNPLTPAPLRQTSPIHLRPHTPPLASVRKQFLSPLNIPLRIQ